MVVLLGLAVVAPASAGAPRRAGLVVWPARTSVVAGRTMKLHIANHTRVPVSLSIHAVGVALDQHGAPRVIARSAGTRLLVVRTRRLLVAAGGVRSVGIRARAVAGLNSGDRPALLLLAARSAGGAGIGVQVRIGVPVEVRVPGLVQKRLVVGPLHVRGRRLELTMRNRGNVDERLDGGTIVLEVWRGARLLARLQPRARDLFPRARGVVEFRLPRLPRGRARLVARVLRLRGERRVFSVAL